MDPFSQIVDSAALDNCIQKLSYLGYEDGVAIEFIEQVFIVIMP